jgi:hypothetical protein
MLSSALWGEEFHEARHEVAAIEALGYGRKGVGLAFTTVF